MHKAHFPCNIPHFPRLSLNSININKLHLCLQLNPFLPRNNNPVNSFHYLFIDSQHITPHSLHNPFLPLIPPFSINYGSYPQSLSNRQQNILSFLHNFLLYTWIINSWSMNNSLISRHCNVSLSILSFLLNLFHGLYNYILPLIDNFKLSLLHENFIRIERKWVRMRAIKPILLLIPLDLSLPIILKNHLLSLLYHWILNQHKRIPLNPDKFLWNRL